MLTIWVKFEGQVRMLKFTITVGKWTVFIFQRWMLLIEKEKWRRETSCGA